MELAPGEEIIFQGHPSWRSILGFYIKGLLLAALAGAIAAGVSRVVEDEVKVAWAIAAGGGLLAVLVIVGYVKRFATTYTISSRRLHIKRGIVARKLEEARIERVQNVNTSQSVLERILQVGTVDFDVASGERGGLFQFKGVANPERVVRAVDRATHAGAAPSETSV